MTGPAAWPLRLAESFSAHSPLCRLTHESRERALVAARPAPRRRPLADVPSHSDRSASWLEDFRRRLEAMIGDLRSAGVLTILVVPPGNDAGFEPNRSILPPETPRAEREAFCRPCSRRAPSKRIDPAQSIRRYRDLIASPAGLRRVALPPGAAAGSGKTPG